MLPEKLHHLYRTQATLQVLSTTQGLVRSWFILKSSYSDLPKMLILEKREPSRIIAEVLEQPHRFTWMRSSKEGAKKRGIARASVWSSSHPHRYNLHQRMMMWLILEVVVASENWRVHGLSRPDMTCSELTVSNSTHFKWKKDRSFLFWESD